MKRKEGLQNWVRKISNKPRSVIIERKLAMAREAEVISKEFFIKLDRLKSEY